MRTKTIWSMLTVLLVIALLGAACQLPAPTSPGAQQAAPGGARTVSVLAVWGGDELDNFRAMIAPFEESTGIKVEYEGTRDLNAVLTTRIEGGNPPDLAGLPGPGQLLEYARAGHLVALNDVLDMEMMQEEYDPGFLQLATVEDNLYGIFIKAAVKSLVWYNPKAFDAAGYTIPTTWDELIALSEQMVADGKTPWCIGLESGAASGWPGTDWIEDIMLRTAGPDYILETFPIVKRKDVKQHGEYRTKRVILAIYDEMVSASAGGPPYQTRLNPPPSDPRVAHPPREHASP